MKKIVKNPLKTRYVEICKLSGREYEKDIYGDRDREENWIVLRWFYHTDFESQEELNDQSEIFMDGIARDTDSNRPLRIMEISHEDKERRATYKQVELIFPNAMLTRTSKS